VYVSNGSEGVGLQMDFMPLFTLSAIVHFTMGTGTSSPPV